MQAFIFFKFSVKVDVGILLERHSCHRLIHRPWWSLPWIPNLLVVEPPTKDSSFILKRRKRVRYICQNFTFSRYIDRHNLLKSMSHPRKIFYNKFCQTWNKILRICQLASKHLLLTIQEIIFIHNILIMIFVGSLQCKFMFKNSIYLKINY